jgi:hypothetical protein
LKLVQFSFLKYADVNANADEYVEHGYDYECDWHDLFLSSEDWLSLVFSTLLLIKFVVTLQGTLNHSSQ